MSVRDQLLIDMKNAMRARDQLRLDTVRFALSKIKNAEIDLKRELNDEEIQVLIRKEVKNRQEAIDQYNQAGRVDIVEEELLKIAVLDEYLPQQMSDDELRSIVEAKIKLNPDESMGKIIGEVMREVKGQADGNRVSQLIKSMLA